MLFVRSVDVTGVGDVREIGFERDVVRAFGATAKVLTAATGSDVAFRESPTFHGTGLDLDCLDAAGDATLRDLSEFADLVAARRMVVHVWMTVGERFLDVVPVAGREQYFEVPADWRPVGPDGAPGRHSARFFNGAVWTTGTGTGRGDQLLRLLSSVLPAEDADRAEARLGSFLSRLAGAESRLAA